MRKALKVIAIQALPLLFLLLGPWSEGFASLIPIGLLVAVAFGVLAWSIRTRNSIVAPVGWAVLVTTVAVVLVTEQFEFDVNLDLLYILFLVSLIGGSVLTFGIVQSLINADPAVNLDRGLVSSLGKVAYRFVVPAFLSMPFVYLTLSQFHRASYNGANPNEFHFLIGEAKEYILWTTLALLPFACGVMVYWIVRWIRPRRLG